MEKSEAHQLYLEPSLILRTYRFLRILFVINVHSHPGEILFTSRSPLNKALLFRLKFPGSLKEPFLLKLITAGVHSSSSKRKQTNKK